MQSEADILTLLGHNSPTSDAHLQLFSNDKDLAPGRGGTDTEEDTRILWTSTDLLWHEMNISKEQDPYAALEDPFQPGFTIPTRELARFREDTQRLLDNACRSYRMLEEARRPRKVALIRKDSEIDISLSEEIFREAILALSEVPETCRSSPAAIEAMHMVLMDWAKASREEWRKLKQCFQEAQDGSTRRDRDNTSIDSLMPRIGGLRRRYEEVKVLLAEETSSRQAFRNEFQSRLEIKIARRIEEEDKTGKGTLPRATLKKVPAEAAKVSPEVIEALKRSVDLEIREIQAARSQLRPFLDSPEVQMPGADGHSEPVSSQFSQEGRKREDEVEAFQFAVRLIVARQFSGHCDELAKKILAKNLEQNEILLAKVWERLLPVLVTLRYVYGQLYR